MKHLDQNAILSWGLMIMGILSVGGWIAISIITGTNNGTEIPLSIASGLVGVLTGKKIAESRIQTAIQKEPPNEPVPTLSDEVKHIEEQPKNEC